MPDKDERVETVRSRFREDERAIENISSANARLATQASLALNGGSFVVMPAYIRAIFGESGIDDSCIKYLILASSIMFFSGIMSSAWSFFVAYQNSQYYLGMKRNQRDEEISRISEDQKNDDGDPFSKVRIDLIHEMYYRLIKTQQIGIYLGYASYGFFALGFILLATTMVI